MELILWRHAEAHEGAPDLERELTGKGNKQAEKMAAFLRARLPETTRILVSPAVRAQQTARAFGKSFTTEPGVGPDASAQSLLRATGWPDAEGAVLVVGHQPVLGQIAALLLADSRNGFSVKKGAIWWLSRHTSEGDYQTNLRLAIAPESL
ncbi:MAG: phosphohistidine phosphatase SixA [Gallionella sp.]|nr:phosphohistidine phosphatase SixA [Gallionella sp.]OIO10598.1 MAG: phosphohistidine phosphatase SixA [Gallionellaceae bacterium CG1_02_60_325]PIR09874.1 MAG: phosphohistidine phosphatase SixA [Gallionellaceae bacterium CG11_big_fil_rev_8_21_14_0_20_60_62]PIY06562.1 MAG: phosphohistidine phosphatase SixA [Gallionellaceae bacterium CG_4_10_14_3_um_filter_60_1069]NCP80544.1 phosphohistidine phosphatase SixA [Gallionella sp.]